MNRSGHLSEDHHDVVDGTGKAGRIRILLADADHLNHKRIQDSLEPYVEFRIVAQACSGDAAVDLSGNLQPDVVLVDADLPQRDALNSIQRLCRLSPSPRVIAVAAQPRPDDALHLIHAGAVGYLQKDAAPTDLLTALRTATRDTPYFSPCIAGAVLKAMICRAEGSVPQDIERLSTRERQVLAMIADSQPSRVIAEKLNLSIRTVETYRDRLRTKLKLHSIAELKEYAATNGVFLSEATASSTQE